MSYGKRKSLIEPDDPEISKSRQCQLLGISRSSLYYEAKGLSERDLSIMRAIDEQYLKTPYYGRRRMRQALRRRGYQVSEKKVRRLMQLMGLKAMAPGPSTSRKSQENKTYPYLLRNLKVTRVNQVWCTDISVPQEAAWEMRVWPLAAGLQEQAANHRKRRWLRARCRERYGKGADKMYQVWIKKTNTSEPLHTCRKCTDGVKTGEVMLLRDKPGGYLLTVQAASGIEVA